MSKVRQRRRQHKKVLGNLTKAEIDSLLLKGKRLREIVHEQFESVTTIPDAELRRRLR